jgi:hypothetical protein
MYGSRLDLDRLFAAPEESRCFLAEESRRAVFDSKHRSFPQADDRTGILL